MTFEEIQKASQENAWRTYEDIVRHLGSYPDIRQDALLAIRSILQEAMKDAFEEGVMWMMNRHTPNCYVRKE